MGKLGFLLGAVIFAAAMLMVLSGGEFGGKTTVEGDQDLPPVATAEH